VATDNTNNKQAGDLLYEQVYVPVFFQKLAEFGLTPQTPAQAESLLKQAQMIRRANAIQTTKEAAASGDPLLIAEQRLAAHLNQLVGTQDDQDAISKFAADLAKARPDLAKAAIEYQNAQAQEILAQQS